MNKFDISKEALIIRLSISAFSLKGQSDTIRSEAAAKHNADKDSIDAGLKIFQYQDLEGKPGSGITKVLAIRTKAKNLWKRHTLNWEEGARRLCLTRNYPKLRADLDALSNSFNDAVQVWLGHYADIKADFHKRLNGLSKEINFPTFDELQHKFHFSVNIDRITSADDIRWSHIDTADTQRIRHEVENSIREKLADTQRELIERIQEVVEKLKTKCSDSEAGFKNSIINNIRDLVAELPELNILDDPKITEMINRTAELAKIDPQIIRDNPAVRTQTITATSAILDDLANFQPIF